jgi:hypothetical protein
LLVVPFVPHAKISTPAPRSRPAGVQLVLCSRFDPPLAPPRLRLAVGLWELRAGRMSFTALETAELLAHLGVILTSEHVEVLRTRTGGWAAGLRLAGDALIDTADRDGFVAHFSGDERSVADYLAGAILSRLPSDTLEFLRVISISDPVPATLAELSGREDARSRCLSSCRPHSELGAPPAPRPLSRPAGTHQACGEQARAKLRLGRPARGRPASPRPIPPDRRAAASSCYFRVSTLTMTGDAGRTSPGFGTTFSV